MKLLDVLFGREPEKAESKESGIARELRRLSWLISTGVKRTLQINHKDLGSNENVRNATFQVGVAYDDFPKLDNPEDEDLYRSSIGGITDLLRQHGKIAISLHDFFVLDDLGQQKGIQQVTLIPACVIGKPIMGEPHGDFMVLRVLNEEESDKLLEKFGMGAIQKITGGDGE